MVDLKTLQKEPRISVVSLHDSAIEDCIVSEISSTSKVRTSSGDNSNTTI
jgi:hypothetical protein